MLTPARPSASATSATIPGRFGTRTRSSCSGPPAISASISSRRRPPACSCQAATASRSPERSSSAASVRRATAASISAATASRLPAKMSPQIAGLAPATRVASRKLGPDLGQVLGLLAERRRRLGDEHVGEHVRQVADRRHQPVVGLGLDRLRPGAHVGDRALHPVVEQPAGAGGRRQVPAGALEEVGAGVLDPRGLRAGQRVAADEAGVRAERGDHLALHRADVGDGRSPRPPASSASAARPGSAVTGAAQKTSSAPSTAAADALVRPSRSRPARRRGRAARGRGRSPPPRHRAWRGRRARSSRRSGRRRGRRPSWPGVRPPRAACARPRRAGRAPARSCPSPCRRR